VQPAADNAPAPSLTALLQEIRAEQHKVDAQEGDVVAALFRIGALLVRLKQQAQRAWTAQVKDLGYHPRVARRLQKLGSSPLAENGLAESALLQRLPTDLMKLEWLCRLKPKPLSKVLAAVDCKAGSRKAVIDAAKTTLNIPKRPRPRANVRGLLQAFNRFVGRVQSAVAECGDGEDGQELRRQLGTGLADGFDKLREILGAGGPANAEEQGTDEGEAA
jgi:hypothetical protein